MNKKPRNCEGLRIIEVCTVYNRGSTVFKKIIHGWKINLSGLAYNMYMYNTLLQIASSKLLNI